MQGKQAMEEKLSVQTENPNLWGSSTVSKSIKIPSMNGEMMCEPSEKKY